MSHTHITVKDKLFKPFITADVIAARVSSLAKRMNSELAFENPLFIVVLNGSFMFAADLLKEVNVPCEISFIKVSSYEGTKSTGLVNEIIGLKENIVNRTIVVVEDIVDTGNTIESLHRLLHEKRAGKIFVATMLLKPEAYTKPMPIEYVGMEIGNDFVVGYGLDYDGYGRNLKDIYVVAH